MILHHDRKTLLGAAPPFGVSSFRVSSFKFAIRGRGLRSELDNQKTLFTAEHAEDAEEIDSFSTFGTSW